jgi:hypothetical protein
MEQAPLQQSRSRGLSFRSDKSKDAAASAKAPKSPKSPSKHERKHSEKELTEVPHLSDTTKANPNAAMVEQQPSMLAPTPCLRGLC